MSTEQELINRLCSGAVSKLLDQRLMQTNNLELNNSIIASILAAIANNIATPRSLKIDRETQTSELRCAINASFP